MSKEYKMNALFNDLVIIDGFIYYYSAQLGFLRKGNMENGSVETLFIPHNIFTIDRMVNIGKTIYAFDVYAKSMLVYNIVTHTFEIADIDCGDSNWGNYVDVFAHNEQIYIVSKSRNCIYRHDTKSKSMSKLEYDCPSSEKGKAGVLAGDEYILFVNNGKEIVRIDLDAFECKEISGYRGEKIIRHCYFYMDYIYLLCEKGEIIRYDRNEGTFLDYYESDKDQDYIRLIVTKNNIFVLPLYATGDIVRIHKEKKEGEILNEYPIDFNIIKQDWSMYAGYYENDDIVVFSRRSSNYCLVLDKQSESIRWQSIEILSDEKERAFNLQRYIFNDATVQENITGTLRDYLNAIRIGEVTTW